MSENGEIYTAGKKFYTPAGTDGMDKFHLWKRLLVRDKCNILEVMGEWTTRRPAEIVFVKDFRRSQDISIENDNDGDNDFVIA